MVSSKTPTCFGSEPQVRKARRGWRFLWTPAPPKPSQHGTAAPSFWIRELETFGRAIAFPGAFPELRELDGLVDRRLFGRYLKTKFDPDLSLQDIYADVEEWCQLKARTAAGSRYSPCSITGMCCPERWRIAPGEGGPVGTNVGRHFTMPYFTHCLYSPATKANQPTSDLLVFPCWSTLSYGLERLSSNSWVPKGQPGRFRQIDCSRERRHPPFRALPCVSFQTLCLGVLKGAQTESNHFRGPL